MTIPPLNPGRDHTIGASEAAEMTRRHRGRSADAPSATSGTTADATAAGVTAGARLGDLPPVGARPSEEGSIGGLFSKKAVLSLLSRADAQFLRYYHARDEQGNPTIVLVAADVQGNDLLDGGTETLDRHWPCPPYCPPEASVLRG